MVIFLNGGAIIVSNTPISRVGSEIFANFMVKCNIFHKFRGGEVDLDLRGGVQTTLETIAVTADFFLWGCKDYATHCVFHGIPYGFLVIIYCSIYYRYYYEKFYCNAHIVQIEDKSVIPKFADRWALWSFLRKIINHLFGANKFYDIFQVFFMF